MHVTAICVGEPTQIGRTTTGINKKPVEKGCEISTLGVSGDSVCDAKYHGGPDQAVYVYGGRDYAYWANQLGRELDLGTFGENVVFSELSSLEVFVGDRFHVGDVRLEATAPRIPCATLGARMGDPKFPIAFRRSRRSGFYCRVLSEGIIEPGMSVRHEHPDDDTISIEDVFELNYDANPRKALLFKVLRTPIAIRERQRLESLLTEQRYSD